MKTRSQSFFALICAISLSLIGTETAVANSKTYDASLEDRPCDILTADMVATTLDVAVENLEQSGPMIPFCTYEMEKDGKVVNVVLTVASFASDEIAAESFRNSTQNMSAEEMATRLQELGIDLDENNNESVAGMDLPDLQPTGVQFEDIDGIADQARFQTNEGALHIQQGNLQMTLLAYSGSAMPLPEEISFAALHETTSTWVKDTINIRKEQVVALAKTVIERL